MNDRYERMFERVVFNVLFRQPCIGLDSIFVIYIICEAVSRVMTLYDRLCSCQRVSLNLNYSLTHL